MDDDDVVQIAKDWDSGDTFLSLDFGAKEGLGWPCRRVNGTGKADVAFCGECYHT